jgi:hypothetical protein
MAARGTIPRAFHRRCRRMFMADLIITPSGPGAMEAGLVLDDDGGRFVVLKYKEPGGDAVIVTFTVPIFQHYVEHLVRTAAAADVDANWGIPG